MHDDTRLASTRLDSPHLDCTRLRAEMFFIHRALNRAIATHRHSMLDDLHTEAGGASVLIWRSLFSDCLRVVYCVTMADGVIYDFELERIRDLVDTASQHYTGTRDSPYGHRPLIDLGSIRTFLAERYAQDSGPFGYGAAIRWRGHRLCCRAEAAGTREPLQRYARLMWWLIEEVCKVSDVNLSNPRWRAHLADIDELRQALTGAGFGPEPDVDRRVQEFRSAVRVFAPVEQALSVYEADPFDVEMLHGDARARFRELVRRATTEHHTNSGRTLLLVGSSGAGKTHLLRSFWSHVQEYGRGFVAYAQMHANVDDYTRYLLHHIVESLKCPYSGSHDGQTGLHELALGLARLKGEDFAAKVERLAELHGGPRSILDRHVNDLVDELLGHAALVGFHPDLLRVLLYALCRDPKTTPRVYQYLRCDGMNDHDRSLIGNVVPLTGKDDPREMIHKLARLAFVTRSAALVLMVDQLELSGVASDQAMATFQRAVDALLGIASEVPSVIVVIACLSNLYDKALRVMGSSTRDRLDKDPPSARLSSNLSYDEIKAIVSHRLAYVFADAGTAYRATEPVYPIPEAQLRNLVNRRPRDILEWCQQFHERCVAAGKIVEFEPVPPPPPPPPDLMAAAWNDAYQASRVTASLTDDELLALVTLAARAYAAETEVSLTESTHKDNRPRLTLSTKTHKVELVIGVTDSGPQGGAFGKQISKLRKAAGAAIAVAVRTDEFPSGAASAKAVKQLTDAGGRTACLDKPTLRALVAYQAFKPAFPAEHIEAWKRNKRPISSLPPIAAMFGFEPHQQPSAPALAGNGAATHTAGDIPAGTTVPPPAARAAVQRATPQVRAAGR